MGIEYWVLSNEYWVLSIEKRDAGCWYRNLLPQFPFIPIKKAGRWIGKRSPLSQGWPILRKKHRPLFKTLPNRYVIPEGDEGAYQESPLSVSVHSYKKKLAHGSVRDPCFRMDDQSFEKSIIHYSKPFQIYTSFLKATKEPIRNLLSQFPFIPIKKLADGSVRDPRFRGNDPSSGKSLLNNLHTST